jgi:hypothetical protein
MVTFPNILTENENNNFSMSGRDPEFLHNMRPNSLLSMTAQQVEKVTLKTVPKHKDAQHRTTLQCMRLKHVNVNFKNSVSTAWVSEKPLTPHDTHNKILGLCGSFFI